MPNHIPFISNDEVLIVLWVQWRVLVCISVSPWVKTVAEGWAIKPYLSAMPQNAPKKGRAARSIANAMGSVVHCDIFWRRFGYVQNKLRHLHPVHQSRLTFGMQINPPNHTLEYFWKENMLLPIVHDPFNVRCAIVWILCSPTRRIPQIGVYGNDVWSEMFFLWLRALAHDTPR